MANTTGSKDVADFDGSKTGVSVLRAEHEHIALQRPDKREVQPLPVKRDNPQAIGGCFDTIGLALSGGGIRSAAFCTGALQGLAANGVMPKIDYLSTVSGGGYVGAALTVSQPWDGGVFPFLQKTRDEKTDSAAMRQMRNNANYLKFGDIKEMIINLAIYLRGLVANLIYVTPVILGLAAFTLWWNPDRRSLNRPELFGIALPDWFIGWGAFAFSGLALLAVLFLYVSWSLYQSKSAAEELNGKWTRFASYSLLLAGVVIFLELQPFLVSILLDGSDNSSTSLNAMIDNVIKWFAPMTAVVSLASSFLGDTFKGSETQSGLFATVRKIFSKSMFWIAGLALPLLMWLLYLRVVATGVLLNAAQCPQPEGRLMATYCQLKSVSAFKDAVGFEPAIACLLAALLIAFLWNFLSPNGNSLHRLYRERLGHAFCFRMNGDVSEERDRLQLSKLTENRPYHLINTAINVQNSEKANAKGRNADFFLFSPLYIGSDVTDYASTGTVERVMMNERGVNLDIATAIAISGAAASSNMGTETIKPMALTLAFLNIRLGYWFPNPKLLASNKTRQSSISYFVKEAFGRLDENGDIVYLTDGGHIENLGVFELLKRRCKLIIAVDAEADPGMTFPALIKLQRYARIDLGARIDLKWSRIQAVSLQAQKDEPGSSPGPHCAIGKIEYDNGGVGVILYVKSSVTGDENDYIKDYNRRYRAFPHESTGDQFFSEEQFEVYRALGFHAVDGLLKGKHKAQTSHSELESLCDPDAKGFAVTALRETLGIAVEAGSSGPKAKRRLQG
jgi:Patatin-like phospholipase